MWVVVLWHRAGIGDAEPNPKVDAKNGLYVYCTVDVNGEICADSRTRSEENPRRMSTKQTIPSLSAPRLARSVAREREERVNC